MCVCACVCGPPLSPGSDPGRRKRRKEGAHNHLLFPRTAPSVNRRVRDDALRRKSQRILRTLPAKLPLTPRPTPDPQRHRIENHGLHSRLQEEHGAWVCTRVPPPRHAFRASWYDVLGRRGQSTIHGTNSGDEVTISIQAYSSSMLPVFLSFCIPQHLGKPF